MRSRSNTDCGDSSIRRRLFFPSDVFRAETATCRDLVYKKKFTSLYCPQSLFMTFRDHHPLTFRADVSSRGISGRPTRDLYEKVFSLPHQIAVADV